MQLETRNSVKLFLRLIPIENVPQSNLLIQDAEYLKYIVTVLPKITPEYISQNIVFAPNPILKLNAFKILPEMVKILSLEDAMALVIELVKFKEVWNLNVKETISNFDKLLDSVDKNKKLLLSL